MQCKYKYLCYLLFLLKELLLAILELLLIHQSEQHLHNKQLTLEVQYVQLLYFHLNLNNYLK
ncbi:MAG: hypothetical protein CMF74_16480 [Maricaulis sp.]|nr:hypothetical protein [Maricaulis sp.]